MLCNIEPNTLVRLNEIIKKGIRRFLYCVLRPASMCLKEGPSRKKGSCRKITYPDLKKSERSQISSFSAETDQEGKRSCHGAHLHEDPFQQLVVV